MLSDDPAQTSELFDTAALWLLKTSRTRKNNDRVGTAGSLLLRLVPDVGPSQPIPWVDASSRQPVPSKQIRTKSNIDARTRSASIERRGSSAAPTRDGLRCSARRAGARAHGSDPEVRKIKTEIRDIYQIPNCKICMKRIFRITNTEIFKKNIFGITSY